MPQLRNLIHIPNEGKRTNGGRLIAEGMRAGVSDLFLPTARGGYHGLWIELKRVKGGRVSDAQAEWIRAMREEGYAARVCFGWVDAMETIMKYMRGDTIDA